MPQVSNEARLRHALQSVLTKDGWVPVSANGQLTTEDLIREARRYVACIADSRWRGYLTDEGPKGNDIPF